jgi:hypothetical protein
MTIALRKESIDRMTGLSYTVEKWSVIILFLQINVTNLLRDRFDYASFFDFNKVVVQNTEYFAKLDSLISKVPKRYVWIDELISNVHKMCMKARRIV